MRLIFLALVFLPQILCAQEPCTLYAMELLSKPGAAYGAMPYTEMISIGPETWVGRYDPHRAGNPGWQLEYVSGAAPTAAQIHEYARMKSDQPLGFDLSEVVARIDQNSVRMTRRSLNAQWFGFEPVALPGESQAFVVPLEGYVSRPTDGRCHLIVEISSDDPFSPAPGLWVSHYRHVVVLGKRGPDQLLYPLLILSELQAIALPATRLDKSVRVRFSYY